MSRKERIFMAERGENCLTKKIRELLLGNLYIYTVHFCAEKEDF